MKIKLLGKNLDDIRPLLAVRNLLEVQDDADMVITYGGDGALLGAARDFAHLPILAGGFRPNGDFQSALLPHSFHLRRPWRD